MTIRLLAPVALVALFPLMALSQGGCYDDSDACRDFCEMAANCLHCGGNVSLTQCKDECVALSIDQKKALATCAKDCPNMYACEQMVGFPPPNPCEY